MPKPSRDSSNTANSRLWVAYLGLLALLPACMSCGNKPGTETAASRPTSSTRVEAQNDPPPRPLPRRTNRVGCKRSRSGTQPIGCVPERDSDQHPAVYSIRVALGPYLEDFCDISEDDTGSTDWLPPLSARCSLAADRRCKLVDEADEIDAAWEYHLPDNDGIGLWKRSLGDAFEESLARASSFHMRLSWKRNTRECLILFEAWSNSNNDETFYAEGTAILFDSTGGVLQRAINMVGMYEDDPAHEGKPGRPAPLTMDLFLQRPTREEVLDRYLRGKLDGSEYPGPLEDHETWLSRKAGR